MKNLKVIIYSPYCILRPTTNRIFDMRMSDALAGKGAEISLVYPYTYMKENIRKKDIASCYGLEHKFKTRLLPTVLFENSSKWMRFMQMMLAYSFHSMIMFFENIFSGKKYVFFSRDAKSLIPPLLFKKYLPFLCKWKVVFMAAEVKNNRTYRWVLNNSDGVFAGVTSTKEAIKKIAKVDESRFLLSLAPVPVYKNDVSKTEARNRIGIADSEKLVVYTGKLGLDVQEVLYILDAAALLKEYVFLFTGGRESVVRKVKTYCQERHISNVMFTGFMDDSTLIRNYQLAADVLVSYYTSRDHMVEFNYPQKINEYLSTGNPVITPNFPATQDVLNETNVFFVKEDSPQHLAQGIRKLMEDRILARMLAEQAKKDSEKLSFESRATEIIRFISQL
ncbi:MAG: glycosyltransferase [Bacteroidetes bacterium]|nr:MAG: glycosyltransferase [Bacteroidota bacterium]REK48051.1 MAG: glycosyltransferase [Bacteroidota bacterium]